MRNFASCSFPPEDLAYAIANYLASAPQAVEPFIHGVMFYLNASKNDKTNKI